MTRSDNPLETYYLSKSSPAPVTNLLSSGVLSTGNTSLRCRHALKGNTLQNCWLVEFSTIIYWLLLSSWTNNQHSAVSAMQELNMFDGLDFGRSGGPGKLEGPDVEMPGIFEIEYGNPVTFVDFQIFYLLWMKLQTKALILVRDYTYPLQNLLCLTTG
ncbi:hypothetical protein HHK36_002625 [Tetracentron sinense]|uniref:Uncharacterized protein n=1 Tax=Tetracentron sinense TaxID=13715 RepID=A0A835DN17_TETSI|nr:hypothetical protein HHK36_002625 [Tetracentron sinense]